MKNKLLIIISVLFFACAKDDGNYSYKELNTIEINGIDEKYNVDRFDILYINPKLVFGLEKEIDELEYKWMLNDELISTQPVCSVEITQEANIKAYKSYVEIKNKENDLTYYKEFEVQINTVYSNAFFALIEKKNGEAVLAYQRRDIKNPQLIEYVFETENPSYGNLGYKPQQLYYGGWGNSKTLGIICKEGDKKITFLDPNTMEVTIFANTGNMLGGEEYQNIEFHPDFFVMRRCGMIAADGKLFGFNYAQNNQLNRPVKYENRFAPWADGDGSFDTDLFISYDIDNESFVRVKHSTGVNYDNVEVVSTNELNTKGQKFLAASALNDNSGQFSNKRILLFNSNQNKAYFYEAEFYFDFDMNTFEMIYDVRFTYVMTDDQFITENSLCYYASKTNYWFVANGGNIKRLHELGGNWIDIFTSTTGEITSMFIDEENNTRLFVATYDGTQSYIYIVNTNTREIIEEPMKVDGKVVSMIGKGDWKWNFEEDNEENS